MREFIVNENESGQRLDKLIFKYLNLAPKSFVYKMLRKKNITLNSKKCDGSEKTVTGDIIKFFLSDETIEKFCELQVQKVNYDFKIIYEDRNIILVSKPAGILSQKAKPDDISINEQIISYLIDTNQITEDELKSFKPSVVNRLDRNTTGIIAAGKTLVALQTLSKIFKDRTVKKYYRCIVSGRINNAMLIEGYLKKNIKTNQVMISKENSEEASYIKTGYNPVTYNKKQNITLLNVELFTGRTHQIRAHLASEGNPIIGDSKYGDKNINLRFKKEYGITHQMLHSYEIVFPKLEGELENLSGKSFIAPPGKEFKLIEEH